MNRESNLRILVAFFNEGGQQEVKRVLSALPSNSLLYSVEHAGGEHPLCRTLLLQSRGDSLRELISLTKANTCTHLLTVDMQDLLYLDDLPTFFTSVYSGDSAIYVASRSRKGPFFSRILLYFRRYFNNMWVRFYTGADISDASSTLRLYPIHEIASLDIKAKGYEVEQEILLKASWNGVKIKSFAVNECTIPKCNQRRGFQYNTKLTLIWIKAFFHRFVSPFSGAPVPGNTFFEKVRNLVTHELRSNTTAHKAAISVALGVYFGLLPIHGFQLVALLFIATKFRCNRPLAFLGVNISIPPLLPFVFYFSIKVGSLVTGSGATVSIADHNLLEKSMVYGVDFVIGSLLLAHSLAILTYLVLLPLFSKIKDEEIR